jgi:hypothetical protein
VRIHNHMDIGFEVWTGQGSWFWYVLNPNRNGATIGAAASEMEAIREARSSIAEMSARRTSETVASFIDVIGARAVEKSKAIQFAASGWNEVLAKLDSYLTQVCDQFV